MLLDYPHELGYEFTCSYPTLGCAYFHQFTFNIVPQMYNSEVKTVWKRVSIKIPFISPTFWWQPASSMSLLLYKSNQWPINGDRRQFKSAIIFNNSSRSVQSRYWEWMLQKCRHFFNAAEEYKEGGSKSWEKLIYKGRNFLMTLHI